MQRNAQVIASFTAPLIQRHSPLCGTRDLGLSFRPNHLHIHGFRNVTERLNYEKCYLITNFLSSDLHISRVKVIPDSIHFGAFGLHLHISLISSFDFFLHLTLCKPIFHDPICISFAYKNKVNQRVSTFIRSSLANLMKRNGNVRGKPLVNLRKPLSEGCSEACDR